MKPIVLDLFRRWGWLYFVGFILALGNDLAAISLDNHSGLPPYFFATILGPVFVLGFDLMRGAAGVHFTLPVAKREIGRSYWIVGVCVPTVLSTLALISAIFIAPIFQISAAHGWDQLPLTFAASVLIAGSVFLLLTLFNEAPQKGFWNKLIPVAVGGLWGASMFSPIFLKQLLELRRGDMVTIAALTVLGLLLTVIGWLRAEQVVVLRARKRVASYKTVRETDARPAQMETGISGLPYLFLQSIKFALGVSVVFMLFGTVFRVLENNWMFVNSLLLMWSVLSGLRFFTGLRHIRSLPISIDRVTFIILALPLLNFLVCLAVIVAMEAIFHHGAFRMNQQLFAIAGLTTFGTSVALHFGPLFLPFIMGFGMMAVFGLTELNLPVAASCTLTALLMIAAYGIVRRSLQSSKTYRVPAANFSVG